MTQPPHPQTSQPAPHETARPPAPLLEREADVAALRAVLDAARDGNGRLAVIEGSAGIGKTRLLAEVRAAADSMGLRVLSARGGALEGEFAFGIVRQLFEPMLATAAPAERDDLLAGAAGLAAPLFGESGLAEPAGDISFAILHGLYWLAANAALSRPTVLLVDDLHWSDAPSLRWLTYVARRLEGLPLMLIVGSRPPEQSEQTVLVTELVTDPGAMVLRPGVLGPDSVRTLARELFSDEPEGDFCAACCVATGGNPLYLRALLIALAGDGVAPTATSAPRVQEVGPEPVARVVSLRLSRLSPAAAALAQAVAVLGEGADLGLAAELAGVDRTEAAAASAALARTELLRLEPELEFAHPVVRAAVYEAIGPFDRADAHRRAAGLLVERRAEPERSASHLLLVSPAGDPLVVRVLRDAARRALARGAPDVAVIYLRRALAEPPEEAGRGGVLWELGAVERFVDLPSGLEHLRDAVGLIDEPARHAEAALDYGRAEMYANLEHERLVETFEEAIHRLGASHPELRELLEADLLNGALGGDAEVYRTAADLLSQVDDRTLSGGFGSDLLLAGLAHFEVRRGVDRARTVALAERAMASGLIEQAIGHALYYPAHALGATGHIAPAMSFYERAGEHARQRGDRLTLAGLLGFRGALETDNGDLVAAEQDLREGIELARQSGVAGNVMYLAAWLADFLLERGGVEEAEATLADLNLPEQVPELLHFIFFLGARGKVRLVQRKTELALNDFLAIGRIAEQVDIHNPAFWPWRSHAAIALDALERPEDARELAVEELVLARRWGAPLTVGRSLRALGLIDVPSERERWLREALDVLAASQSRLEHARVLVDLGAALRRRNERSRARELLRQGAELAVKCGAIPLVERANEELAATGARPRKVVPGGLDSLTASERRVAKLAADELSNKEIAQTLFVTVKTVEVHLSHIYRKLDIGSRRQLSVAFAGQQPERVGAP